MTILESIKLHNRTLSILLDPEKMSLDDVSAFAKALSSNTSHLTKSLRLDQILLLVGGSTMHDVSIDKWLTHLKQVVDLQIVLFPGSASQVSEQAHGLLFLNLISGRNPEFLIGQQVKAAAQLRNTTLEIIPTAYLLLDGGHESAVSRVSQTLPMSQVDHMAISNTALAGQLMGNQLIYLEAGSGARFPVSPQIVSKVSDILSIPVIVGGGLKTIEDINNRFDAGASMVVVGTAWENDLNWKG
ncbi:geranylgeranylglyceryl/heptaprenylglyceryl phosphate synthase [Nonlabens ponticola]|uniref:Geranylgeranylglyceryl/heptaprenylglyceryl phosphate synthase n=1 Tax=Nonlabens ponticola TaxID=2496866 RepID=A0A3S9MVN2_9FLAO|nr:geranylgeranylglyceryl/heptaprenylglyceryl phosphate synthase [Nonlabens ponticola]AZQ43286.1 geranylgeranylglyceryl/heptaprenylglyceryl phosphate synthase [Nonlabens ponticola]